MSTFHEFFEDSFYCTQYRKILNWVLDALVKILSPYRLESIWKGERQNMVAEWEAPWATSAQRNQIGELFVEQVTFTKALEALREATVPWRKQGEGVVPHPLPGSK